VRYETVIAIGTKITVVLRCDAVKLGRYRSRRNHVAFLPNYKPSHPQKAVIFSVMWFVYVGSWHHVFKYL
jgi:hypothetical protein